MNNNKQCLQISIKRILNQIKYLRKMQKTSQIKRSLQSNSFTDDPLQTQSSIQDLITKIQECIVSTSQTMKNKLQKFEFQELISYKDDLLKTQDQFIKIRAERNEEAIKTSIMEEKSKVQQKFTIEMKNSIQMSSKYDDLKKMLKKMNEEERQLLLEINYMKKKIDLTKKQGLNLDIQLEDIKSRKVQNKNQTLQKAQQQKRMFSEVVNKCDKSNSQNEFKQKQKQSIKSQLVQKWQKKEQRRLKHQICDLKEYIDNIPLELNFIQNKIYDHLYSTQVKKVDNRLTSESQLVKQNCLDQENKQNNESEIKKETKLPRISKRKHQQIRFTQSVSCKNQSKYKTNSLQVILSDNQVKQFLYNALFG